MQTGLLARASSELLAEAGKIELCCPREEKVSRRMHFSLCRKRNKEGIAKVDVKQKCPEELGSGLCCKQEWYSWGSITGTTLVHILLHQGSTIGGGKSTALGASLSGTNSWQYLWDFEIFGKTWQNILIFPSLPAAVAWSIATWQNYLTKNVTQLSLLFS